MVQDGKLQGESALYAAERGERYSVRDRDVEYNVEVFQRLYLNLFVTFLSHIVLTAVVLRL